MKFPRLHLLFKSFVSCALVALIVGVAMTLTASAQKASGGIFIPELVPGATLEQCRNGPEGTPLDCTGSAWAAANADNGNSYWRESQINSYRILFTDLAAGPNSVVIGFDFLHMGLHAFDYLGTYNHTNTGSDPCSGIAGCAGWATSTAATPTEPALAANVPPISQIPGVFTFFGADINGTPAYVACPGGNPDHRCVQIDFTPHAGVPNPVLAFGAHFAWRGEWGAGQTAADFNGAPYHMRLISLNGGGIGQDLSMADNGVFGPGALRIVKSVTTFNLGTSSTVQFFFNATSNFGTTNFFLVDDDAGPGDPDILSIPILTDDGVANVITFTEDISQFPVNQNWSYNGTVCVESISTAGTVNVPNGKTVVIDEKEVVVCTVNNTQLAPSAAHASVSGRTVDSFGNGISGARIMIMNAASGELRHTFTNPFGYYTIDDLEIGGFYVVTVSHKRYAFTDDTRTLTLNEDFSGLDFVANPLQ